MAKEHQLWEWLRNGLCQHGHLVRVENLVAEGTPDVNYCFNGREGWVELKSALDFPKRPTTPVFGARGLRPEQIEWLVARSRHKGNAFIAARCAKTAFLVPAYQATRFNAADAVLMRSLAVFWHVGPMGSARWAQFAETLAGARIEPPEY